jgi:carbon monoxide dehydrogenase subunit G
VEFDNTFEVPLPPAQAWPVLMDIRRIAPCMPGAELTEVVDHKTYKGKVAVRLGPVALAFAGTVLFEELDNANYRARVKAQGNDSKGRGGAHAMVGFRLEPVAAGSKVLVHTDLSLSGAVAQYGRGVGMIQATAAQIMSQFANNLKASLAQSATAAAPSVTASAAPQEAVATSSVSAATPAAPPPPPPAAKPISGFSLMARVLWEQIKRIFGRNA